MIAFYSRITTQDCTRQGARKVDANANAKGLALLRCPMPQSEPKPRPIVGQNRSRQRHRGPTLAFGDDDRAECAQTALLPIWLPKDPGATDSDAVGRHWVRTTELDRQTR